MVFNRKRSHEEKSSDKGGRPTYGVQFFEKKKQK